MDLFLYVQYLDLVCWLYMSWHFAKLIFEFFFFAMGRFI